MQTCLYEPPLHTSLELHGIKGKEQWTRGEAHTMAGRSSDFVFGQMVSITYDLHTVSAWLLAKQTIAIDRSWCKY